MIYTSSQADTIAAASEALMRCAHMLDREADATFDAAKLEDLAAKRIQIEATARMIEGLLDDGGSFNGALWQPDALRAYVECELAADDGGRVAADTAVAPAGSMVPLWVE